MSSFVLAPRLRLRAAPPCSSCWQFCVLGPNALARPHWRDVSTAHCRKPQQRKRTENSWQGAESSEFKFLWDGVMMISV